ncbi:MAG: phosphomannomutase [Thioalkalivibrionaceae bacterium]
MTETRVRSARALPPPFLGYDIRGRVDQEVTEAFAFALGRCVASLFGPRRVALGGDARLSTPELKAALAIGLAAGGASVVDFGLTGTEQIYFACFAQGFDVGIEVTASHNPPEYNGFKIVLAGGRPLDDVQFAALAQAVTAGLRSTRPLAPGAGGRLAVVAGDVTDAYIERLLEIAAPGDLPPLHVLLDAGHGAAGPLLRRLREALRATGAPLEISLARDEPDGEFPDGVPNPHDPRRRAMTQALQRDAGADVAAAFDGDFDRCFLFGEGGAFVQGYYLVGVLAASQIVGRLGAPTLGANRCRADRDDSSASAARVPLVLHDPRLFWNTQWEVTRAGGRAACVRTGHTHMKAAMRARGAVYAGEISGHHYFSAFGGCDSGMLPWLLALTEWQRRSQIRLGSTSGPGHSGGFEHLEESQDSVSFMTLFESAARRFPASEELNFIHDEPSVLIGEAERALCSGDGALGERPWRLVQREAGEGLGLDFGDWRLRLRRSQTEPLVRLTLESRGDQALLCDVQAALEQWLRHAGAVAA